MNRLTSSFLILLTVFAFIACSKDDDPKPGINGLWTGKYGSSTAAYPTNGYAFLFRSNGTVRVFNGIDTTIASKAEGTYAILGTTITTNYTYQGTSSTYSTSATVNTNYTFMEGTWGSGTNTTNGGQFFIYK
ncbi:MAG: hypothetical protein QM669_08825 [Siphonobacter sp.]